MVGQRARLAVAALAAALSLGNAGCLVNMMAVPYFLFVRNHNVDPPAKLVTKKKEKKRVLVLSYANSGLQWGFDQIDEELTGLLIGEIARGEKRLEVIPENKVRAWRDTNSHWADMSLQQIGEEFDVDYVVFIEALDFSLNEGKNQYLLKGRTRILFKVHDVAQKQSTYDNEYIRDYPRERLVSVSDVQSENEFRKAFLRRIARELAWYVVPHDPADELDDK